MDTSETYIKMCDCPEIQEQRNYSMPNSWAGLFRDNDDVFIQLKGLRIVWLPRQDQLQEMLKEVNQYYDTWVVKLKRFYDFAFAIKADSNTPDTMEQLWLAFVMNERYSKVWNGEEWITS